MQVANKKCSFCSHSWPSDHRVDASLMTSATVVMPSIILFIAPVCAGTAGRPGGDLWAGREGLDLSSVRVHLDV